MLDKLKTTIWDPHASQPWRRRQEIWRLIRQLHFKKKLHTLRDKHGQVLPDAHSMANEILHYWSDTMASGGPPPPKVSEYLRSFFKDKPLTQMAQMLIKPLSQDLVHTALEGLHG